MLRTAPDSRHVSFRVRGFSGNRVDVALGTVQGRVERSGNRKTAHATLDGQTYRIERPSRKRVHALFDAWGAQVARLDNSGRMREARLVLEDGRLYRVARRSAWGYTYEVFDGHGMPMVFAKARTVRTDIWSRPDVWALPHPLALSALLHEAIDHVRTQEATAAVMAGVMPGMLAGGG